MPIDCLQDMLRRAPELAKSLKLTGNESKKMLTKKLRDESKRIANNKRQLLLTNKTYRNLKLAMENKSPNEAFEFLRDLMSASKKLGSKASKMASLEDIAAANRMSYESTLADMLRKFRPKRFGFSVDTAGRRMLAMAAHGDVVPDADIMEMARMWSLVIEDIRQTFNKYGGNIKKLEDFGMPHIHDIEKVPDNFEEWHDNTVPLLNVPRIMEQLELENMDEFKKILMVVHQHIKSEGTALYKPNEFLYKSAKKLGNKHQASRVLHFKDGESFVRYNDLYGNGDLYKSMLSYLDNMSRQTAALQILGPNPEAMMKRLMNYAEAREGKRFKERHKGNPLHMYDEVMGNTMDNMTKLSYALQAFRNLGYGSKLAAAPLSAIVDAATIRIASKVVGLPMSKVYNRYMKNILDPTDAGDKYLALKLGVNTDYLIDMNTKANRFGEQFGSGMFSRFADLTIRVSGLNHHTVTSKNAFSLEFLSVLADIGDGKLKLGSKNYNKIVESAKRYGITKGEFVNIIRSEKFVKDGVSYVNPQSLSANIRQKLVSMVRSETQMAVPEPNARVRAIMYQGLKTGTVAGDLAKTFGQFKTFPATMLISHWSRGLSLEGASKIGYMADLFISATVIGMISLQAKEVSKGRTPIIPRNGEEAVILFLKSVDQGAAFGIIGDAVSAILNTGISSQLTGPVFNDFAEISTFLTGTMQDVYNLEDKIAQRFLNRGVKLVGKALPLELWYVRAALENAIWGSLERMTDPDWATNKNRVSNRLETLTGQRYWWEPGDIAPKF